ncbi:MAG TPA: hypothetical protein PLX06_10255 [Fimbriimonadaceae bacterium]|nr:hypothetical protein [Fimbriimonadaceae bacterium]
MRVFRLAISGLAVVGLGLGYLASQFAFFQGRAADYAQSLDQPAVRYGALALMAVAAVLAFIPNSEEEQT